MCLIFNAIGVRSGDAAQSAQTLPCEVITLANRQCLLEQIGVFVKGKDESPNLATTGLGIRSFELICPRLIEQNVLMFNAVVPVCPVVTVIIGHPCMRLINLLRMIDDVYIHDGITCNMVRIRAGLVVCRTMEGNGLVAADGESRIEVNHLTNGEV